MTKARELSDYLEYKRQEVIVKKTFKTEAYIVFRAYKSNKIEFYMELGKKKE